MNGIGASAKSKALSTAITVVKKQRVEEKETKHELVDQLLQLALSVVEGQEHGAFDLGDVTMAEFEKLLEDELSSEFKRNCPAKIHHSWENGKLFISFETSPAHSAAVTQFIRYLPDRAEQCYCRGDESLTAPAAGGAAAFVKQADATVTPRNLPLPAVSATTIGDNPFPTFVLEVGYDQSLTLLREKAAMWLGGNTTIRIVVVVKLYKHFQNGNQGMVALRFHRGIAAPVFAVSFGTAPLHPNVRPTIPGLTGVGEINPATGAAFVACNGPGLADYQLRIPTALLYTGVVAGPPAGAPAHHLIDLWLVQDAVVGTF